jgi:hypothetical protein
MGAVAFLQRDWLGKMLTGVVSLINMYSIRNIYQPSGWYSKDYKQEMFFSPVYSLLLFYFFILVVRFAPTPQLRWGRFVLNL